MNDKEQLQEDSIIKKQQQFVNWLKSKGIYNEFDSAHVMQRMQDVWKHATIKCDD